MDHETTLQDLKSAVKKFIVDRNWESFHNPKKRRNVHRHRSSGNYGTLPVDQYS